MASIGFRIIVPPVIKFLEELPAVLRLANAMHAPRKAIYGESENFPWGSGYISHYPVFLDCLGHWAPGYWAKRLQGPSSDNNAHVPIELLLTGWYDFFSFEKRVTEC